MLLKRVIAKDRNIESVCPYVTLVSHAYAVHDVKTHFIW